MPIEVKHRPAPELQLQMAEYAGQGQYRKWLAEYKAKQEQAKTQAFLSAFGQGSKIGLAGRAQKHAAAMQTQRFGHEAGMFDTRNKAAIEAARLKRAHDLQMQKIRQTQSALGAAGNAQSNAAVLDTPGNTTIRDWVNNRFTGPRSQGGFGSRPGLWSDNQRAQAAQWVKNIDHALRTPSQAGTQWYKRGEQALQGGRQSQQQAGMFSAGGGGARRQGAIEAYRRLAGDEIAPVYSNRAQEGVRGFQSRVALGETIIPAQGIPGTPGFVPAIKGTGTGQSGPFSDDESRVYMTGPEAAAGIRSMRQSLQEQFRRERNSIAQHRMKTTPQPFHREGTPVDKQWYKWTDPITGEEKQELRDNVAPGVFAFQHNSAPGGNFDQMKEEDAGFNEMRAPYVESWKEFQSLLTLQGSMTREEWIEELKEGGYDKWHYGPGKDDFIEMPENGWAKGAPFPGIPMEGMSPATSGSFQYDPHQHKEHWEQNPDGTRTRSYRRMWMVAPTSYNTARNEDVARSRNRLHRRMQQQAMEGGGPTKGRAESQAWRAYVDKYGHDPDEDLQKKFLRWEAQDRLDKEDAFLKPRGIERHNVVDLRQEPLAESDMRTLGEVMTIQRHGQLTPEKWKKLGPEAKTRYRRLFHLLDLKSGYSRESGGEGFEEMMRWALKEEDTVEAPSGPPAPPLPQDIVGKGGIPGVPIEVPEGTRIPPSEPVDPRQYKPRFDVGDKAYVKMPAEKPGGFMPFSAAGMVARAPTIGKGWGIRVGDKLMYIENPDPERTQKIRVDEKLTPDPNVLQPDKKPPPPPSAGTVLPQAGVRETQSQATRRGREPRSVAHQRAHNAVNDWVDKYGNDQDRQDMIRLNALWKKHGNSMRKIMASKDSRIEYKVIMERLNQRVFRPEAEKSLMKQSEQREPMD